MTARVTMRKALRLDRSSPGQNPASFVSPPGARAADCCAVPISHVMTPRELIAIARAARGQTS